MTDEEKVDFYNLHKQIIHPIIKSNILTKPIWRRLYWTTGKDSDQYKIGAVNIFIEYFETSFLTLNKKKDC